MRVRSGRAGVDKRGFWVNDPASGLRLRIGEVGINLARETRDLRVLKTPRFGFWFEKSF